MLQLQCSDKESRVNEKIFSNPKLFLLSINFDNKDIDERNLISLTTNQENIYLNCVQSQRFGSAFMNYLKVLKTEECNWKLISDLLNFCKSREDMIRFIDFCTKLRQKNKVCTILHSVFGSEYEALGVIALNLSLAEGCDLASKVQNPQNNFELMIDFVVKIILQLEIKSIKNLILPQLILFWKKSHYNLSINVINILEKRIKTVKDLDLVLEEIQKYIDLTFIKLNDEVFINHNNIRYCQAASICYPLAGLEYELMKKLIMRSEFLQDEIILERVTIHGAVCFMYKMELNMYIRYNGELWSKIRDYKAKFDSVTNVQQKETQTEANSQSDDLDCGFRNDHIIRTIVELIQKRQQEEKEMVPVVVYKNDNRDLKIDETRDGLASKYCKLYSMYGKLEVDGKSSKEQKTNRSIQNDQSFIQIIDGHYNKNAEKINEESVIYYKNDKINNRSFDKQVVGLNISSRIRGEQKTQDRKKTPLILKKNTLNGVKINKNAPLKKLTLSPLPKYKKFNNQLSLESAKQSSLESKKYKNNNYSMSPQDIIQGIKIL